MIVVKDRRTLQAIVTLLSRGASDDRQTTTLKMVAVNSKMSGRASDVTSSDSKESTGEQRHWPVKLTWLAVGGLKMSQAANRMTWMATRVKVVSTSAGGLVDSLFSKLLVVEELDAAAKGDTDVVASPRVMRLQAYTERTKSPP